MPDLYRTISGALFRAPNLEHNNRDHIPWNAVQECADRNVILINGTKEFTLEQVQGELSRVTEELDEAIRKKEIALDLYYRLSTDTENTDLFDKVVDLTYENEQLRSKIQMLQDKLEKAYEFMKQFVINGRNMLDVFRERIGEVKEWVHRKVAGMSR